VKTVVLVVASVVLLAWQATGVANAARAAQERSQAAGETLQGQPRTGLSDEEATDLATVAEQHGMSFDEALGRYGWNNDFALGLTRLRSVTADSFSAAEIVDSDAAWISFAASVPDAARDFVKGFQQDHPRVVVELRSDVGFSEAEINSLVETTHYTILKDDRVEGAATWFDWDERRVVVNAGSSDKGPSALEDSLRDSAERAVATAGLRHLLDIVSIDVSTTSADRVAGDDNSISHRGGEALDPGCTSGFIVGDGTGAEGPATAAHCSNSLSDDGSALSFRGAHAGTHGDVQWHTGPQPEDSTFYAGSSATLETDPRRADAVAAPTVGQTLCTNGRTNKKQCQEVRRLGVCNGPACNLVQMGARRAAGGDSGGPVYFGTTAYGLHQGFVYDPVWPYDRDVFSRADRLPDALGVAVVK